MMMSELLADMARLDREAIDTLLAMPHKYETNAAEFAALSRARARLLTSAQESERMAAEARTDEQQGVRA